MTICFCFKHEVTNKIALTFSFCWQISNNLKSNTNWSKNNFLTIIQRKYIGETNFNIPFIWYQIWFNYFSSYQSQKYRYLMNKFILSFKHEISSKISVIFPLSFPKIIKIKVSTYSWQIIKSKNKICNFYL